MGKRGPRKERTRAELLAALKTPVHLRGKGDISYHHLIPQSRFISRPCGLCEYAFHHMFVNRAATEAKKELRRWLRKWGKYRFDNEFLRGQTEMFRACFYHFFQGQRDLKALDRILDDPQWSPEPYGITLTVDEAKLARAAAQYGSRIEGLLPISSPVRGPDGKPIS